MEVGAFNKWLISLEEFNTRQERVLKTKLAAMAEKRKVSLTLETPKEELKCPHCRGTSLIRWGKRNDMRRYMCKDCKRTFNSLTNTPLARLRRKGHWVDYARCLREGLSIREAARICGIDPSTSFRWRHRFLTNITSIKAQSLNGIVEVVDVSFPRSEKGSRNIYRVNVVEDKCEPHRNNENHDVWVVVGRDRNKNTFDTIVKPGDNNEIKLLMNRVLGGGVLLCSDRNALYRKMVRKEGVKHGCLNVGAGEKVKKGIVHIQNVTDYHKRLKEWIFNRFHGVATKYLENYLAWLRELDEFEHKIPLTAILLRAKNGGNYKKLPLMRTSY